MASLEELKREVMGLQRVMVQMQRDMSILETKVSDCDVSELREMTNRVRILIEGDNGKNGLKSSVDRLALLIDGDQGKDVIGLRKRLETVEKNLTIFETQRNQIKWIIIGLSASGLTNAGALITLLMKVLGGGP